MQKFYIISTKEEGSLWHKGSDGYTYQLKKAQEFTYNAAFRRSLGNILWDLESLKFLVQYCDTLPSNIMINTELVDQEDYLDLIHSIYKIPPHKAWVERKY